MYHLGRNKKNMFNAEHKFIKLEFDESKHSWDFANQFTRKLQRQFRRIQQCIKNFCLFLVLKPFPYMKGPLYLF